MPTVTQVDELPGVLVVQPRIHEDARGAFWESWRDGVLDEAVGWPVRFVQDNHSRSLHGVLRGLHYQLPPHAQGKLVRCTVGEVWDVAVDLRRTSPWFGRWWGMVLSAANHAQLWIPPGFAHGFVAVSDQAEVQYKVTHEYAPDHERCIVWNDPHLQIDWPLAGRPVVSDKDAQAPRFADAEVFDRDPSVGPTGTTEGRTMPTGAREVGR